MDLESILAEAESAEDEDAVPLAATVKRQHVHWTMVETSNPEHKKPSDFTREQFYKHLEKCYLEVYPDASSPTGTILLFGAVAQEPPVHLHAPTFSRKQHYWNKVKMISLQKYNVPLNAVAHSGYLTMYAYHL